MSSAFWSALAKLDDNVQIVQSQVDWLRAGFEFDDDQLVPSLTEARQNGATIRDLVRAEGSAAKWNDRKALEQLIHELEVAAQERRNQQRRIKLQDLANELDAGRITHRLEARAAALSKLRQEAVKQLRTEAALADQVKDLPGPRASQWLHWACNLQEEKDGFALTRLRQDFAVLERFVGGMEESYWAPGQAAGGSSWQPTGPGVRPAKPPMAPPPAPVVAASVGQAKPPQNVRPQFEQVATRSGSNGEAVSVLHETQSAEPASLTETLRQPEAATQWKAATATVGNGASKLPGPRMNYCDQCGSSYRGEFHVCPVDPSIPRPSAPTTSGRTSRDGHLSHDSKGDGATAVREARSSPSEAPALKTAELPVVDASTESAESEFERLKALVGESYAVVEDEEVPQNFYQRLLGRLLGNRQTLFIAIAVGVVLLGSVIAMIHHFSSRASKAAPPPQTVSAKAPDVIPDSDIQKGIEQKLTALKGSTVQVEVQDGVVTLTGKIPSKGDLVKAETMAAEVSGVKQVTNKIQVEASNGKGRAKH